MTNEGKPDLSRATTLSLNNRLEETLGKTIQVSRIGRATDPKPKDKIWFTTQLQDLFVLDTTAATQSLLTQIESDLLGLAKEYDLVTHDFGTAQVVGTDKAAPISAIINYCRGSKS